MQSYCAEVTPSFQLKGGSFTLTVIQLFSPDCETLAETLPQKILQAPKFFSYAPVILDCQKIAEDGVKIDFKALVQLLRDNRLIPVGVRGANMHQQTAAVLAGLAVMGESRIESSAKYAHGEPASPQAAPPVAAIASSKLITQPVRSGQQSYTPESDLVVVASVSAGAELLSDRHIHVYGPLRGRALAGITGDPTARIFCQSLEAELVSIAGHYLPNDTLREHAYWKQPVCISLQGENLQIALL